MNPTLSNLPFKTASYSSNPLSLPQLGNPLAGITPGPKSMVTTPSIGGTNQPTTQTPRNTNVSSANQTKQVVQAPTYQAPVPGYNPPAVNLKIDPVVPSDAFKTTPNTTATSEGRKNYQQNVLTSKYAKEEEALLSEIVNLRTGIAGLKGTQAKEFATAETNPSGMFGGALGTSLNRLSKDQALELNARTGQLNAYLDNLELYQGYRPDVIGSPQIDEATGEAFVYMQDPTTGEMTTQSLGVVATPNPAANYQKVGDAIIDPTTGKVIYQAPQEGYTLGKDQVRYDASGRPIAYGVSGTSSSVGGGYSGGSGMSSELSRMVNVQGSFIQSENQRESFQAAANSYIQRGDYNGLKYYLRNQAVNNVPAADQSGYRKNIEIVKGLDNLEKIINKMESKGVGSGILTGSWQSIQNKLGAKGDPELVSLGYQAQQAMDLITRQRTGAALNQSEEKFYKKMVPGIFKGIDLNKQLVQEFKNTLQNNTDSYLGLYFSPDEISTLDKASSSKKPSLEELISSLK